MKDEVVLPFEKNEDRRDRRAWANIRRLIREATDAEDAAPLEIGRCRDAINRVKPFTPDETNILNRSVVSQKNYHVARYQEALGINAVIQSLGLCLEASNAAAASHSGMDRRTHGSIETSSFRLFVQNTLIAEVPTWVLTFESRGDFQKVLASRMLNVVVTDSTGRIWLDRELDARGCASDLWRYDDSPIEQLSKTVISVNIH